MALIYIISQSLLVLVAIIAFWKGRIWERSTAAVLLLNWIATEIAPPFNGVDPPWTVIAMDAAVCVFLIYVAAFSSRRWAIWASAFQLLLMANHLAFVRFAEIQQWAYVSAYYIWGDLLLVALAVGALTRKHRANIPASPRDDENGRR